jgi:hypothetical protein
MVEDVSSAVNVGEFFKVKVVADTAPLARLTIVEPETSLKS